MRGRRFSVTEIQRGVSLGGEEVFSEGFLLGGGGGFQGGVPLAQRLWGGEIYRRFSVRGFSGGGMRISARGFYGGGGFQSLKFSEGFLWAVGPAEMSPQAEATSPP